MIWTPVWMMAYGNSQEFIIKTMFIGIFNGIGSLGRCVWVYQNFNSLMMTWNVEHEHHYKYFWGLEVTGPCWTTVLVWWLTAIWRLFLSLWGIVIFCHQPICDKLCCVPSVIHAGALKSSPSLFTFTGQPHSDDVFCGSQSTREDGQKVRRRNICLSDEFKQNNS